MASPQQRAGSLPKGARAKGAEKVTSEKKLSAVSSQEIVLSKRKHQPMNSQMVPVKRIGKVLHVLSYMLPYPVLRSHCYCKFVPRPSCPHVLKTLVSKVNELHN